MTYIYFVNNMQKVCCRNCFSWFRKWSGFFGIDFMRMNSSRGMNFLVWQNLNFFLKRNSRLKESNFRRRKFVLTMWRQFIESEGSSFVVCRKSNYDFYSGKFMGKQKKTLYVAKKKIKFHKLWNSQNDLIGGKDTCIFQFL